MWKVMWADSDSVLQYYTSALLHCATQLQYSHLNFTMDENEGKRVNYFTPGKLGQGLVP